MRKFVVLAAGAAALASASMANAGIVTTSSGFTSLTEVDTPSVITISFTQNPITGNFTDVLDLTNPAAGIYSIGIQTSTPGVTYGTGTLKAWDGIGYNILVGTLTTGSTICCGANSAIGLAPQYFAAGNYQLTWNGTFSASTGYTEGTDGGTVTITSAVPEPATWGLMLLGFGGIGMAMRRRRRPLLAQVA
jgi:hypothetical protein